MELSETVKKQLHNEFFGTRPLLSEVISRILRLVRLERKLQQSFVANTLHLSRGRCWYLDNGVVPYNMTQFVKMCKVYDLRSGEVLEYASDFVEECKRLYESPNCLLAPDIVHQVAV